MNEVRLAGRLSVAPQVKELPSGDEIVQLRVVVPRRTRRKATPTAKAGPSQDTIEVTCWSKRTRTRAAAFGKDDEVEVEGSLHRRFFTTPGGPQSRYEVEATALRRAKVPRAAPA